MRDYNIESDLKQEKFEVIKLVQGDKGNKLTINVLEDGKPVSLTGCSITAKYKRADGQVINGSVTNISNNSFDAVIDSDITKVSGVLKMLFSIEKDDVKVSTFLLLADVREGLLENTGSSGGGEVTVDLKDYQKKTDNGLETKNKYIVGAINEVNSQFKDIAKQIESGNIDNNVEPMYGDIPKMFITGNDWSKMTTAKNEVGLNFEIISKTNKFKGGIKTKYQGNSSLGSPKHNLTCKLYKDTTFIEKLKIDFKGWGKQSKFVAKANWIDHSHARNNVSALLWGDCVRSRGDFEKYPELYKTSPNVGAIDGFPIKLYANGIYQGLYTLNIPKDKWMANMDDSLDAHCILCGENYESGCFRATANINGNDWTDEIHDVVPVSIKTRWNEIISFVMNSTDAEFKENLHNYFYVDSLIDYIIFGLVSCGLDAFGKNQLYLTYDGKKFIAGLYDADSTWGLYYSGERFVSTDYPREQFEDMVKNRQGNLLYIRLLKLFITEIKARYKDLRQDALSSTNIINRFEKFTDVISSDLYKEDYASTTGEGKFTGIPLKDTNNIQQIRNYMVARLIYVDSYINSLVESVPCTAINLDKSTLSFTTTDTQTLIPTLTPTNTTDTVIWSVSPEGIVTVNNGVVTPVSNGECVITAKCGKQTATCNVTVSGIVKHYTITNNLTNCTTSNTTTTIEENSSYSATITANKGYILGTVVITMGENDITSSSYADGVITIENVTGDIIINITASMQEVDYNNPVYTLSQTTTFNGIDDYIDTGIQLFDTSKNATIFIDLESTSSSNGVCLNCMEGDSPWRGLGIQQQSNYYRLCGTGSANGNYIENTTLNASADVRQKMIITIANGVPTTVDILSNNSKVTHSLQSYTFAQLINRTLTLGAEVLDNGTIRNYWHGTIYQCKIWFRNLSDSEKNELFS